MVQRFPRLILLAFLSLWSSTTCATPWLSGSSLSQAARIHEVPVQLASSLPAPCFIFTDGFGSHDAAVRASDQVANHVTRQLALAGIHIPGMGAGKEAERLLTDAFSAAAQRLQSQPLLKNAGASCVALMCASSTLYTANVGHARAVLSRDGIAYTLTTDHTPDHPAEYDRLKSAGRSAYDINALSVTRSFGNTIEGVSSAPAPSVSVTPLTHHDEFVIIGNHDLWRGITSQEAVDYVHKGFEQGLLCDGVAASLVEHVSTTLNESTASAVVIKRERLRAARTARTARPQESIVDQLNVLFRMPESQWMSHTVALPPLMAALLKAYDYMNVSMMEPHPSTTEQHSFVDLFMPYGGATSVLHKHYSLDAFSSDELRVWASRHVEEINNELRSEGFELVLHPVPPPSFYVASLLNVKVAWRTKGAKTKLRTREAVYDAVLMNKNFLTYAAPGHNHPIFVLLTQNKDLVFMTKAPKALSNFGLLSVAQSIQENMHRQVHGFDELIFPMINATDSGKVSWLEGLSLVGSDCRIVEALQETHFKMNEQGAQARSAAAMGLSVRSMSFQPVRTYVIDEPFYCWISRPGMKYPLFAGYLDTPQWDNPGVLFEEQLPVGDEVSVSVV